MPSFPGLTSLRRSLRRDAGARRRPALCRCRCSTDAAHWRSRKPRRSWIGTDAGVGGSSRPVPLACPRAEAVVDGTPRGGVVRREDRGTARRDADAAAPEAFHLAGRSWAAHRNLRAASTASLVGTCGVVARQRAQLRCIMSPSQGRRAGTAPWGKADVIGDGRGAREPQCAPLRTKSQVDARCHGWTGAGDDVAALLRSAQSAATHGARPRSLQRSPFSDLKDRPRDRTDPSARRIAGAILLTEPKTTRSRRRITLPGVVVDACASACAIHRPRPVRVSSWWPTPP